MSARVALATCAAFPQLADDEPLLIDQLRARGVGAEPVVWDEPTVDWNAYELVVVRTTWDYSWRREAFLSWVESLARVLNAADVIRWNTDKRYLAELPHVVPTTRAGRSWSSPKPSAEERRVAEEILDSLLWRRADLLYARVDLIPNGNDAPRLIELELSEPSLYLSFGDDAAARLAEEIVERL